MSWVSWVNCHACVPITVSTIRVSARWTPRKATCLVSLCVQFCSPEDLSLRVYAYLTQAIISVRMYKSLSLDHVHPWITCTSQLEKMLRVQKAIQLNTLKVVYRCLTEWRVVFWLWLRTFWRSPKDGGYAFLINVGNQLQDVAGTQSMR